MSLQILKEKGIPLERQVFTWRDLVKVPISKLDDDAFTKVRIVLMNGLESEAVRFQHACARMSKVLQPHLAKVRRVEHFQQTMVNWLLPPDLSPLETTLVFEQVAIEVTAAVAQVEPDPYLAQVFRFGLLEDFDHLYRYGALYDRVEGKDPNQITQCYTDIIPGRPTIHEHRAPEHDLKQPYDRNKALPLTKLHSLTILSAENQVHDYYMTVGPMFADPVARQLYAEIAAIEEQHVTQYESIIDPNETWLEKWLMHEAMEVYNYFSCVQSERNERVRDIWERFLEYELGQFHYVKDLFEATEKRDALELIPDKLPEPIDFVSHREFVRQTLAEEVDLRVEGAKFVALEEEPENSLAYRQQLNSEGSPSETVAAGYRWAPGTELASTTRRIKQ